jgi:uncharacterized YigZ family protein
MTPMPDSYLTISEEAEFLIKEKGSKFIAFSFKVTDEEEVNDRLTSLKKLHHSARHHCYAYRLGSTGEQFRSNDDGEPNHSAGDPILRQLIGRDLTDTLVVVVRYFGGTKLGVGGLIQAYGGAAEGALELSGVRKVDCLVRAKVSFSYAQMSEVMRVLNSHDLAMENHKFEVTCELSVLIPKRISDRVLEDLREIPFIQVKDQEL